MDYINEQEIKVLEDMGILDEEDLAMLSEGKLQKDLRRKYIKVKKNVVGGFSAMKEMGLFDPFVLTMGASVALKAAIIYMSRLKDPQYDEVRMAMWTTSAISLAASLILLSKKTYEYFFSDAAKHCANRKTSVAKIRCIHGYKIHAINKQINDLERSKRACSKTNEPEICRSRIDAKIEDLKRKRDKIEITLSRKPRKILEPANYAVEEH